MRSRPAGRSNGLADLRKVSPRTVRRDLDRALSIRRLDAPERYAHLQIARLTKAGGAADEMLDQGDVKGVPLMLRAVAALDRFQGAAAATPRAPRKRPAPRAAGAAAQTFRFEAGTPRVGDGAFARWVGRRFC